jgi:hypothetical protein
MSETDLIRAEIKAHNAQARIKHRSRRLGVAMIPVITLQDFNAQAIDRASLTVLCVSVCGIPYECSRDGNTWQVVCDRRTFTVTGGAAYLELALMQESRRRTRKAAIA